VSGPEPVGVRDEQAAAQPVVVDVAPFALGPVDAPAAALCIHGLTGTPYEVRPLGEALARAGIRAIGPALPGHNRTPQELARVSHQEWEEAVDAAFAGLRARHARAFVVGLSLGGLLSLSLAARTTVDGLAVVGTPLRLRGPAPWLVPVAKRFMPYARKVVGSDIRDPQARRRHPSYPVMPLASVHELIRLQRRVVAHGSHDVTAHPDDARTIVARVGSRVRELLLLEDSGHVVPVDHGGPRLARAVAEHLVRLA
jgi:carboxylesterase